MNTPSFEENETNAPVDEAMESELRELFERTSPSCDDLTFARMAKASEGIAKAGESRRDQDNIVAATPQPSSSKQGQATKTTRARTLWPLALAAAAAALVFMLKAPVAPPTAGVTTPSTPASEEKASKEKASEEKTAKNALTPATEPDEVIDTDDDDAEQWTLGARMQRSDPWVGIELLDGPDEFDEASLWEEGYEAALQDG